jgi:hypothetical protein
MFKYSKKVNIDNNLNLEGMFELSNISYKIESYMSRLIAKRKITNNIEVFPFLGSKSKKLDGSQSLLQRKKEAFLLRIY